MIGDPRLVRALLACYPRRWRHRYGDEYAQLLCDLNVARRPVLILDSLRGAVRAHGGGFMSYRSPLAHAVWATGLFTVAGIGFEKLSEDVTDVATGTYALVVVAAAIALVALVVAATPTAAALLRGRDAGAWKYVAVPVIGAAAWYGVLRIAVAVSGNHSVHSAPNVAGFALIAVVGIAVVVATAWAAATVLRRLPAAGPAGLRRVSLLVLATGMTATTVAVLLWGLQVRAHDPGGFRSHGGVLATPFVPSWIAVVALMAAATAITVTAGRSQLATDRATRPVAVRPHTS
jgi:hypothetical protein